jgi:hypothetical protein
VIIAYRFARDRREKKMSNYIEKIIEEKIAEADLTLDLQGSDRKMLQLACKDFTNYIKFQHNTSYQIKLDDLEKILQKEKSELESFLSVWVARWMKKWQERVKLLIGKHNRDESCRDFKNLEKAEPLWQNLDCKAELTDAVQSTLINNGEICGSELLAEHTLKLELVNSTLDLSDRAQALTFLCNVMRRANEIAKNRGPLLFVEVNKSYFAS